MNEPQFSAEFILPDHLQKKMDNITSQLAGFIFETFVTLYGEDIDGASVPEVLNLLIPKLNESIENAVDNLFNQKG